MCLVPKVDCYFLPYVVETVSHKQCSPHGHFDWAAHTFHWLLHKIYVSSQANCQNGRLIMDLDCCLGLGFELSWRRRVGLLRIWFHFAPICYRRFTPRRVLFCGRWLPRHPVCKFARSPELSLSNDPLKY